MLDLEKFDPLSEQLAILKQNLGNEAFLKQAVGIYFVDSQKEYVVLKTGLRKPNT